MKVQIRMMVVGILGLLGIAFAAIAEPSPLTLKESYELAIKQSESLKLTELQVRIAEAQYREAVAAIFPNVHLNATQRYRNRAEVGGGDNSIGNMVGSGNSGSSNGGSEPHAFQSYLSVKQPIFSGFREFYLSDAAKEELSARRFDAARAKELLYLDVAQVYYQIQLYQGDLSILQRESEILSERIKDLKKFISIGRSKESEVLAVQADKSAVLSTIARTNGLISASKELLAFLTGRPSAEIRLSSASPLTYAGTLEEGLSNIRNRFDLRAGISREVAAEKKVTWTERERWPSLSLEGNVYPYEDPDLHHDWDVLLRLDLPIFEGGAIDARIAQSQAELTAARLQQSEAVRGAERDLRTAYSDYKAAKAEVEALERQVAIAKENAIAQRGDYEKGIVTNLEVLAAIRAEQDATRQLLSAQNSLDVSVVRLEVTAGGVL